MIISVSGKPGSGKSTLAKMLAERYDFQYYYMGGLRRDAARRRNMTIEELNALGEKEPWTDYEIDEYQKTLANTRTNFIIDSRTAFHFIPHSLKIFIDVEPRVGAERVFGELRADPEKRNEGANLVSVDAVLASHLNRMESDRVRYQKYYGIDTRDLSGFNFVLDTTNMSVRQAFERLIAFTDPKVRE